jgi:acyl carrier protein
MNLKEEVIKVIADTLEVEENEVVAEKKLYDSIGVDSTEMVELTVTLSKKFGVKVAASEISKFSTPLEIAKLIEGKKG